MVAEATLISESYESAEWFYPTVFLVFLEQEGRIVDVGLHDEITQHSTDQDVVDTLPTAFVAVGSFCTMRAFSIASYVVQSIIL